MLNDYIRRSDVLKLFDEWGGGFKYMEVETDGAIEDVNNLPGIGHCSDCDYYNSMFCTMVECFDNGTAPFDFCSYFKERDGEALPPIRKIMSNKEWIDFLSEQFNVSRTSARGMLHGLIRCKAEDNFKKQFSGGNNGPIH